jgi:hypothetical protein
MADDAFAFLAQPTKDLTHPIYCTHCYDAKITPALEKYNQIMEQAKEVHIYFKTQGKETRTIKRKEKPLKITDCEDYDEALLRLAFLAAQLKYNALVDVVAQSKKAITKGYQKLIWSVTGTPTNVTDKQLNVGLRNPN